jgi:branched-chain amino acid transport system permease protein
VSDGTLVQVRHDALPAIMGRVLFAIGTLGLLIPSLLHNPYHINLATNAAITLIIALSLNLVVGYSGQFALSHAAFFGIGAYVPGLLATRWSISPWLGLLAGLAMTTAIATIVSIPVARLRGYFLSVATLAFGIFIEIFVRQATELTGGAYGVNDLPALVLFGHPLRGLSFYFFAAFTLFLIALLLGNMMRSGLGRAIVAMRDSPGAAAASGIHVTQMRVLAFVLSADIVAIAGWLQAFLDLSINPQMLSPELTFVWLFMVLIGGLGHPAGVVLGTLLLTLGPNFVGIASVDRALVVGVLMIVVALFAPQGLGGLLDLVMAYGRDLLRARRTA